MKKFIRQMLGYIPSKLPVGVTEFNSWVDKFFETYELPTAERDDVRIVLASMIINMGNLTTHKPNRYFYKAVLAASMKQVAGAIFQEIQTKKFAADKVAKRDADAASRAKVVPNETK